MTATTLSPTTTLTFTDTSPTTNSIDMLLDNVRVTNANSRILTVDSIVASGWPRTTWSAGLIRMSATRPAIGVAELPRNSAVEVEFVFEVSDSI